MLMVILNNITTAMLSSIIFLALSPEVARSENLIRIMPLGDSITQGDKNYNSYRRLLWKQLYNEGYNFDFVGSTQQNFMGAPPVSDFDLDHEGHWGRRVDQILENIGGWVRTTQPDIVLIHLGTNDIIQGQSVESTIAELKELIYKIRNINPRIKILIAQIIPCGEKAQVRQLNAVIAQLASQTNSSESPVISVDQFSGFNPTLNVDTYDGCHPNESGEKKMASRWFTALKKLLIKP